MSRGRVQEILASRHGCQGEECSKYWLVGMDVKGKSAVNIGQQAWMSRGRVQEILASRHGCQGEECRKYWLVGMDVKGKSAVNVGQ